MTRILSSTVYFLRDLSTNNDDDDDDDPQDGLNRGSMVFVRLIRSILFHT